MHFYFYKLSNSKLLYQEPFFEHNKMNDRGFRIAILVIDMLLLAVSATVFYKIYDYYEPVVVASLSRWNITLTLMLLCFFTVSLVYPPTCYKRMVRTEAVVKNSITTTLLLILLVSIGTAMINPTLHFPRRYLTGFLAIYGVALSIERLLIRKILMKIRAKGKDIVSVVLIGNTPAINELAQYFKNPEWGCRIIKSFGSVDDFYKWNGLGNANKINEVYVSFHNEGRETIGALFKYCDNHVIRCNYVPSYEFLGGRTIVNHIDRLPYITQREEPLQNPLNKLAKRSFDLIVSTLAILLLFWWVYLICAAIIKLTSPGPVLFRQRRTGLNGKEFIMYKFRSMAVNAEADTLQATKADSRKYPFGNFMRKTNIDELPQLLNIWKGEMSIVGPRPHMLKHTDEYSALIDKYMVRHFVKSGLTGLAQVSGFRGETKTIADMENRVKKDIEYIENWSFLLDLKIIAKTFLNMLKGDKKAY